jgi:hypothetical protein
VDNQIAAYHVGERTNGSNYASFPVGVASQSIRNFGAFIYFYIFSRLESKSIHYINVGGAETASLHNFKLKAMPIEVQQMDMLVYGYR